MADHLIPGMIFFREIIIVAKCNRVGHVASLYKCMCKIRGRYLPAFVLWRPLGERLQQCESHFIMEEKVQQGVCIDFCFRLGKSGAETYEMLQAAFGESCLSRPRHLSGIPISKVDADPLKTTPAHSGLPPPIPRRPWHVCEKSFVLTDV